jgi:phospholipid transport system transporter-binding protein
MILSGPAKLPQTRALLEEGLVHVRGGASIVDLAEVSELDSSLLATLLAWIREARSSNGSLKVANLPSGLQTLAQLYGIEDLLPVADRP